MNQKDYLDLIYETAKTIQRVKMSGENVDPKQVAELWSIYYNAFAGALRAGAIFSKSMDFDGYPKYQLTISDRKFTCRDAALRDILKDDYDHVTRFPYQDTSESYVKAYTLADDFPEIELESMAPASGEGKPDPMDAAVQAKMKKKIMLAEQKKKEAILREKNRQLLKDARGFDYDPNYDHYYSDRLPEVLQELDSSAVDNAARIVSIVVSAAGIFLALALL